MSGPCRSILRNLLLTAEAVADDDGFLVVPNSRKKDSFAEGLGDLVLIGLEAEGVSHATAAGVEKLHLRSRSAQDLHLVFHAHRGVVMAVTMDDDLFVYLRWAVAGGMLDEEFTEQEGLIAKLCGSGIVRE